ncbi:hypothetical protein P9112_002161 [Eukaryota sp. TZLM1-RC]
MSNSVILSDPDSSSILCVDRSISIPFNYIVPPDSLQSTYIFDTVFKPRFLPYPLAKPSNSLLLFQGDYINLHELFGSANSPSSFHFSLLHHFFSQNSTNQVNISIKALLLHNSSIVDLLSSNSDNVRISTDSTGRTVLPNASTKMVTLPQAGLQVLHRVHSRAMGLMEKSRNASQDIVIIFDVFNQAFQEGFPFTCIIGLLSSRSTQRSFSRLLSQLQSHHKVSPCWRESGFNHLSRMVLSDFDCNVLHHTVLDGRPHLAKGDHSLLRISMNCQSADLISTSRPLTNRQLDLNASCSSLGTSFRGKANLSSSFGAKSHFFDYKSESIRRESNAAEVDELHKALSEEVGRSTALSLEVERLRLENQRLLAENERLRKEV